MTVNTPPSSPSDSWIEWADTPITVMAPIVPRPHLSVSTAARADRLEEMAAELLTMSNGLPVEQLRDLAAELLGMANSLRAQ